MLNFYSYHSRVLRWGKKEVGATNTVNVGIYSFAPALIFSFLLLENLYFIVVGFLLTFVLYSKGLLTLDNQGVVTYFIALLGTIRGYFAMILIGLIFGGFVLNLLQI